VTQQPGPHPGTQVTENFFQQAPITSPPPTLQNTGAYGQNGYQQAQMMQAWQQSISTMNQPSSQLSTSSPFTSPSPPTTFSDSTNSYANLIRPSPIHAAGPQSMDSSPHVSLAIPQISSYIPPGGTAADEGKVVVSIDFGSCLLLLPIIIADVLNRFTGTTFSGVVRYYLFSCCSSFVRVTGIWLIQNCFWQSATNFALARIV
jgi:hypothetical protein